MNLLSLNTIKQPESIALEITTERTKASQRRCTPKDTQTMHNIHLKERTKQSLQQRKHPTTTNMKYGTTPSRIRRKQTSRTGKIRIKTTDAMTLAAIPRQNLQIQTDIKIHKTNLITKQTSLAQ